MFMGSSTHAHYTNNVKEYDKLFKNIKSCNHILKWNMNK